jgi:hypothetical protein
MKKIFMLITLLVSQVFFASESVHCANIKPIESGKGRESLSPAANGGCY